jgi:hypothetical protein
MTSLIVHPQPSIVPGDRVPDSGLTAEPDVTWGVGGIDDWGWWTVESVPDCESLPNEAAS